MTSKMYDDAIKAHNAACAIYQGKLAEYRALTIDDEEFLAAKAVMKEADEAFDAAFEAEASREEEPEEPIIETEQLTFFEE